MGQGQKNERKHKIEGKDKEPRKHLKVIQQTSTKKEGKEMPSAMNKETRGEGGKSTSASRKTLDKRPKEQGRGNHAQGCREGERKKKESPSLQKKDVSASRKMGEGLEENSSSTSPMEV